jgi:hypothetical protein
MSSTSITLEDLHTMEMQMEAKLRSQETKMKMKMKDEISSA